MDCLKSIAPGREVEHLCVRLNGRTDRVLPLERWLHCELKRLVELQHCLCHHWLWFPRRLLMRFGPTQDSKCMRNDAVHNAEEHCRVAKEVLSRQRRKDINCPLELENRARWNTRRVARKRANVTRINQ